MLTLVGRRLLLAVPLLFVVSILSFLLESLAPSDEARQLLGDSYTPEAYAELRHRLGLDEPILVQYWRWLEGVFHGSLGSSAYSGQAVTEALGQRLGVTLSLVISSLLLACIVGVALGTISALRRRGIIARFVDVLSLLGEALPNFWVALVLIEIFAVALRVFPSSGYTEPSTSVVGWFGGLVLPVLALSLAPVAPISKLTRDSMMDVLDRDFITALRARGVPAAMIVLRHALRSAAAPVVTMVGLLFVGLLSGTVLVESVFALPGLGGLAVQSVTQHDLPMIQGVTVVLTILVVIVNTLIDLVYGWLNPKARAA